MLVSNMVTAEDAVRYDSSDESPARAIAGALAGPAGKRLRIRAANGKWLKPEDGQWVVMYSPGDLGVMDDGEYRRRFGNPS